jgi:phenylpyruvate tautomerase PptA (4-oxalocrotonate tautomerase family)
VMGIHCGLSQSCKRLRVFASRPRWCWQTASRRPWLPNGNEAMPYLQLDVPNRFPLDVKRGLARRLGDIYARIMQTAPDLVTVAFRELGEGGVWCCGTGEPEPAALISCDVRRGRPPEQRAELAQALIDACVETLGLRGERLVVEFTQHTSDEMYRPGRGWSAEWTPAEATGAA